MTNCLPSSPELQFGTDAKNPFNLGGILAGFGDAAVRNQLSDLLGSFGASMDASELGSLLGAFGDILPTEQLGDLLGFPPHHIGG